MKIKFSKAEINWIERTADIESARCMDKFINMTNVVPFDKLSDNEKTMINNIVKEHVDLYTFLRTLRTKLEMWDSRYDIDTEIEQEEKKWIQQKN